MVLATVVSACSTHADESHEGVETDDPETTFAPVVAIHPGERSLPLAAERFLEFSTLRWREDDCHDETLAVGAKLYESHLPVIDPTRLGGRNAPYTHRRGDAPACRSGKTFATSDYTRPRDPLRPDDITIDEGFYLDLDDEQRSTVAGKLTGRTVSAPVYVTRREGRRNGEPVLRITYWMLFVFNRFPGPVAATADTAHEGDWERTSVLLRRVGDNRYVPLEIRLNDEDARARYDDVIRNVPWRKARRVASSKGGQRTHPFLYSSLGTHTLYPKPGTRSSLPKHTGAPIKLFDETRDCHECVEWSTWRDVRGAREQSWYGFGGGWGDALGARVSAGGLSPSPWNDVKPLQLQRRSHLSIPRSRTP